MGRKSNLYNLAPGGRSVSVNNLTGRFKKKSNNSSLWIALVVLLIAAAVVVVLDKQGILKLGIFPDKDEN